MGILSRIVPALCALMLLGGCLVTPGKFESTLDIRADRSFTFTYKGEVIAADMDKMSSPTPGSPEPAIEGEAMGEDSAYMMKIALQDDPKAAEAPFAEDRKGEDNRAKLEAIAAALAKEKGFRSAVYRGKNIFDIDYAISGKLTHSFVFPFNSDAKLVFPFIAIELRGDDRVRVKAPGYANMSDKSDGLGSMGAMGSGSEDAAKALDGRFTLTTDAEIISQNQEDGPVATGKTKQLVWKITPLTSEPPMAVLKFAVK
jgi:hypothetical protein